MTPPEPRAVTPFPRRRSTAPSTSSLKVRATPAATRAAPGMARKRPLRASKSRVKRFGGRTIEAGESDRPRAATVDAAMGTIYAIANQKGGVGKTTTAVNVAACIAEAGYPTLLVDIDPQANATVGLGLPKDREPNVYDVLAGDARAPTRRSSPTAIPGLALLPAHPDLAGANVELPRQPGSETRLRDALGAVRERFAFTLLDCPPSLGPLTVNALVAADRVIVPVQTEYFALEGLAGLLDTLALIQRELNPRPDRRRDAADDARRPHAPGARRRARGARALPRRSSSTP